MSDFNFEKFMKDLEVREKNHQNKSKEYADSHANSPQRRYNELYRERWQNRFKWMKKK